MQAKKIVILCNQSRTYAYILCKHCVSKCKRKYDMKERFKKYLEEHFKKIAPTQAAMEYRKALLRQLLDREQELRIKGVTDDNLIFDMAVSELGDFDQTLANFEQRQIKSGEVKRKVSAASICAAAIVALLTIVYLIVGAVAQIWHPAWLIMVGGVFAGASVLLVYGAVRFAAKKKYVPVRIFVAICEVLLTVFVFLLLQLVFKLNGAWMSFLAMVAVLFGVDTAIAFGTNSKIKWFELPVFIEVAAVMLYVILGITVQGIWHPGWLMCLAGVACALVQLVVVVVKKTKAKNKKEKSALEDKNEKEYQKYWTEWDD